MLWSSSFPSDFINKLYWAFINNAGSTRWVRCWLHTQRTQFRGAREKWKHLFIVSANWGPTTICQVQFWRHKSEHKRQTFSFMHLHSRGETRWTECLEIHGTFRKRMEWSGARAEGCRWSRQVCRAWGSQPLQVCFLICKMRAIIVPLSGFWWGSDEIKHINWRS